MLSLATHEPHFKVLREDVFLQEKDNNCRICGEAGHYAAQCTGQKRQPYNGVTKKDRSEEKRRPAPDEARRVHKWVKAPTGMSELFMKTSNRSSVSGRQTKSG